MTPKCSFDAATHSYRISDRPVPSVTQVIRAVLPMEWQASEWYLQRGRAVHAACAFLARGVEFTADPRIAGQIAACREFLAAFRPEIMEVEEPRHSRLYQFAGCPDLVARIDGRLTIIDYKASLAPTVEFQLGAYSELTGARLGMAVELREDGTFRVDRMRDLARPRREFLAMLAVYGIMRRLGKLPREE